MSYMSETEFPKCNFCKCVAGMGLAGKGICIFDGEWDNINCSKFVDDDEYEAYERGLKAKSTDYVSLDELRKLIEPKGD